MGVRIRRRASLAENGAKAKKRRRKSVPEAETAATRAAERMAKAARMVAGDDGQCGRREKGFWS